MSNTTLRGAQLDVRPPTINVQAALERKANLLRWQVTGDANYIAGLSSTEYKDWVRDNLNYFDANMPTGNHSVVLDIHTPPGGFDGSRAAMFTTKTWARDTLVELWCEIAERYKNNNRIFAYGILNEPAGSGSQVNNIMARCHAAIRAVDTQKRVVITCPYSDPTKFNTVKAITGDTRVWYEVHMYLPLALTHQGIYQYPSGVPYPTATLNKDKLKSYLAKVRKFHLDNKARIYVGEFSISTFASVASRVAYLSDLVAIFQEYGWQWTYHAWRESDVWNVEPTPEVAQVLYNAWNLNA